MSIHQDSDDGIIEVEITDVVGANLNHWESSIPTVKLYLDKKQFKKIYKEMAKFYTKKVKA